MVGRGIGPPFAHRLRGLESKGDLPLAGCQSTGRPVTLAALIVALVACLGKVLTVPFSLTLPTSARTRRWVDVGVLLVEGMTASARVSSEHRRRSGALSGSVASVHLASHLHNRRRHPAERVFECSPTAAIGAAVRRGVRPGWPRLGTTSLMLALTWVFFVAGRWGGEPDDLVSSYDTGLQLPLPRSAEPADGARLGGTGRTLRWRSGVRLGRCPTATRA
jgi:hypothetical protein